MQEVWTQWKPIDGLSYGYYIDAVHDTFNGFFILLAEDTDRDKGVLITFENSVFSYRYAQEDFRIKTVHMLKEKYTPEFYVKWALFKVENSEYLKWIAQDSYDLSSDLLMKHFVFISQDAMVDVASTYEPKVMLINNATHYRLRVD